MFDMRQTKEQIAEGGMKLHAQLVEALAKIERLLAALELVTQHDPATPGLHYESIEQLLASAVGIAKQAIAVEQSKST